MRSATSAGSRAAPEVAIRTVRNTDAPVSGRFAQAAHIAGAPAMTVTRWRTTASTADAGSKRSTSSTVDPAWKDRPSTTFRPKMWNSGSTPRVTSPGSWRRASDASTCSRLASRLPWRQHRRLRRPGDPAREDQDREVVGRPDRPSATGSAASSWSKVTAPSIAVGRRGDDELERRRLRPVERAEACGPTGPIGRSGTDRRELALERGGRAQRVERDRDEAGAEHGQVRGHEVPVVGADDPHPVAGLEAQAGADRPGAPRPGRAALRRSSCGPG